MKAASFVCFILLKVGFFLVGLLATMFLPPVYIRCVCICVSVLAAELIGLHSSHVASSVNTGRLHSGDPKCYGEDAQDFYFCRMADGRRISSAQYRSSGMGSRT